MSDDQILTGVIATAMRGDDKYKRWPLPEMVAAQDRIEALTAERDALAKENERLRKRVEAADALAELVAELLESESDHQTEWDITAKQCLAAYRATEGQSHE